MGAPRWDSMRLWRQKPWLASAGKRRKKQRMTNWMKTTGERKLVFWCVWLCVLENVLALVRVSMCVSKCVLMVEWVCVHVWEWMREFVQMWICGNVKVHVWMCANVIYAGEANVCAYVYVCICVSVWMCVVVHIQVWVCKHTSTFSHEMVIV